MRCGMILTKNRITTVFSGSSASLPAAKPDR